MAGKTTDRRGRSGGAAGLGTIRTIERLLPSHRLILRHPNSALCTIYEMYGSFRRLRPRSTPKLRLLSGIFCFLQKPGGRDKAVDLLTIPDGDHGKQDQNNQQDQEEFEHDYFPCAAAICW